jgi:hypothetical protein
VEVGYIIPKLHEPFIERQPPFFLWSSKIIHSKRNTLGFQTFIKIIEIHDFSGPDDPDKDSSNTSSDSRGDGMLGFGGSWSILQWPKIYRLADRGTLAIPASHRR